jgi:hypothetical protein
MVPCLAIELDTFLTQVRCHNVLDIKLRTQTQESGIPLFFLKLFLASELLTFKQNTEGIQGYCVLSCTQSHLNSPF